MKKLSKIFAVLSACALGAVAFSASACGGDSESKLPLLQENIVDDAYDNYYEIFVYSFNDSDGNGVGDLKGVTQKLDYVRDMGYTGIWLMPICPSPSYHKYDVKDYKAIDPAYGTMADFEELLSVAHSKGIKVITDLVVNHSSYDHPWFTEARKAFRNGDTENEYYDYYNFSHESQSGYSPAGGGVYYEARFTSDMPDLNLDSEGVRAEISSIIEFWMNKGVDGFRLDACTSYYTNNRAKSIEFAGWIKQEATKHNPKAYIVGEADWSASAGEFYNSGADSFFWFPAQGSGGYVGSAIATAFNMGNAKSAVNSYYNSMNTVISSAKGYVPAPFLCNHDTGRTAGFLVKNEDRIKFAYGLLSLYSGNTFTYYGDEIGMTGSSNDPDKRVGMRWTATTAGIYPPGVTSRDDSTFYNFPSVEEQLKDKDSILNYYKLCNNARNAFPALMRGTAERLEQSNEEVLVVKKTYGDQSVIVVVNFSKETNVIEGDYGELKQGLCVEGSVKSSGSKHTMPGMSIAIFA